MLKRFGQNLQEITLGQGHYPENRDVACDAVLANCPNLESLKRAVELATCNIIELVPVKPGNFPKTTLPASDIEKLEIEDDEDVTDIRSDVEDIASRLDKLVELSCPTIDIDALRVIFRAPKPTLEVLRLGGQGWVASKGSVVDEITRSASNIRKLEIVMCY